MIFWQILKIIGFVIAGILVLLGIIVLLIKFAPFKYEAWLKTHEEAESDLGCVIKWIAGFIKIFLDYKQQLLFYRIKLAGITVLKGDSSEGEGDILEKLFALPDEEGDDDIESSSKKSRRKRKNESSEAGSESETPVAAARADELNDFVVFGRDSYVRRHGFRRFNKKKEKKPFSERWAAFKEKYENFKEKKEQVEYVWNAPVTKRAWTRFKGIILGLLNHIKPTAACGNIKFGTGDPADTAILFGAVGAIADVIDERLIAEPDMENKTFSADVTINGSILLGYVISLYYSFMTDTDIVRLRRYIQRHF